MAKNNVASVVSSVTISYELFLENQIIPAIAGMALDKLQSLQFSAYQEILAIDNKDREARRFMASLYILALKAIKKALEETKVKVTEPIDDKAALIAAKKAALIAAKKAAMAEAVLNMRYPLRIQISERLFVAGDKPAEKAASKLISAVNVLIAEPLLNGVTEGLISVPRLVEETGAMDIKLVQRACALCTKTLADTLAISTHRSGKSYLRIKYSSSLRRGFGIHWEVLSYQ